ncbi:hypothetical protein A0H81_07899 [Grifola frondosa]|uniref:Uncharacterized protein n=1 Tax=Grifola frondosa TaxID=5627 RepID=A0A1C7M730_GRIFR|nr:hypothetical protein A0H81_07899 [Grifola frondosa]
MPSQSTPGTPSWLRNQVVTYDHLPRYPVRIWPQGTLADRIGWTIVHPDLRGKVDQRLETCPSQMRMVRIYRHLANSAAAYPLARSTLVRAYMLNPSPETWRPYAVCESSHYATLAAAEEVINALAHALTLHRLQGLVPGPLAHSQRPLPTSPSQASDKENDPRLAADVCPFCHQWGCDIKTNPCNAYKLYEAKHKEVAQFMANLATMHEHLGLPPPVVPAEPTWDNSPEPDEPEAKDPEEQWPADAPTCVYCWQKGCDTNCDAYKNYAAANAPSPLLAPLPPSPFVAAPLPTIPSPCHPTPRTRSTTPPNRPTSWTPYRWLRLHRPHKWRMA